MSHTLILYELEMYSMCLALVFLTSAWYVFINNFFTKHNSLEKLLLSSLFFFAVTLMFGAVAGYLHLTGQASALAWLACGVLSLVLKLFSKARNDKKLDEKIFKH